MERCQSSDSCASCDSSRQESSSKVPDSQARDTSLCQSEEGAPQQPSEFSDFRQSNGFGEEATGRERQDSASSPEDAWEIVQAGSSLNDFRGSQLATAQLQPGKRGAAMTLREREASVQNSTLIREPLRFFLQVFAFNQLKLIACMAPNYHANRGLRSISHTRTKLLKNNHPVLL